MYHVFVDLVELFYKDFISLKCSHTRQNVLIWCLFLHFWTVEERGGHTLYFVIPLFRWNFCWLSRFFIIKWLQLHDSPQSVTASSFFIFGRCKVWKKHTLYIVFPFFRWNIWIILQFVCVSVVQNIPPLIMS